MLSVMTNTGFQVDLGHILLVLSGHAHMQYMLTEVHVKAIYLFFVIKEEKEIHQAVDYIYCWIRTRV